MFKSYPVEFLGGKWKWWGEERNEKEEAVAILLAHD
jgi:hypothetical protein